MAEQTIIPAALEAEERERTASAEELRTFVLQWDLETMPACPVGMGLLYEFAKINPGAYEMARLRGFQDTPVLGNNKRWKAFADHCSSCPDCNESGGNFRPYAGRPLDWPNVPEHVS